jgi:hypothetical protein
MLQLIQKFNIFHAHSLSPRDGAEPQARLNAGIPWPRFPVYRRLCSRDGRGTWPEAGTRSKGQALIPDLRWPGLVTSLVTSMVKASEPLLRDRRHAIRLNFLPAVAAFVLLGAVALVAIALSSSNGYGISVLVSTSRGLDQTLQEAKMLQEQNRKLKQEDALMVKETLLMQHSLLEKQKAVAVQKERNKFLALEQKEAALKRKNAEV